MNYNIGDIVEVRTRFGPRKGEILGYYTSKTDKIKLYAINIGNPYLKDNVQHFNETQIIRLYREHAESSINSIKKVIFNKPATIVLWEDGTKTVVKASKIKTVYMPKESYDLATVTSMMNTLNLKPGQYYKTTFNDRSLTYHISVYDEFDPEKGLAMAIAKKALGNKGNYYNEFKKWLPKED